MAKQGCLFSSKFPPNCPEELKEDTSPILITVKSDELPSSSAALSPSRLPVASLSDQKGKYANANGSVRLSAHIYRGYA